MEIEASQKMEQYDVENITTGHQFLQYAFYNVVQSNQKAVEAKLNYTNGRDEQRTKGNNEKNNNNMISTITTYIVDTITYDGKNDFCIRIILHTYYEFIPECTACKHRIRMKFHCTG